MMPFDAPGAAREIIEPSWLLPAALIVALGLAYVISVAIVAGILAHDSRRRVQPPPPEQWAGNPLRPSTWPTTGKMTVDGFFPVRLSPAGERVVVDDATGEIILLANYRPSPWRP